MERKEYIIAPSGALLFPNLKNLKKKKKKNTQEKFLIFPEIELSWSNIKKVLIFSYTLKTRKLFLYFWKWMVLAQNI